MGYLQGLGGRVRALLKPKKLLNASIPGVKENKRTLHVAPEIQAMDKKILFSALKLLRNRKKLDAFNSMLVDRKAGVTIEHAATGHFKGRAWTTIGAGEYVPLKVTAQGKNFFVKPLEHYHMDRIAQNYAKIESYLRKKRYRIAGCNVQVIFPKVIYSRKNSIGFIATDFFEHGEVTQTVELSRELQKKFGDTVFRELMHEFGPAGKQGYSIESLRMNTFYNKKTNTILLFDVG